MPLNPDEINQIFWQEYNSIIKLLQWYNFTSMFEYEN